MTAQTAQKWEKMKLEDALDSLIDYRGKTPKKTKFGIPLVTAKIVKDGFILEPKEFIAESDYGSWMTRGFPQAGDVVLTTEAPLGEVAQIKNTKIALAQRIITLRGKSGVLSSDYLKYYFMSPIGKQKLTERGTGTTVPGIKQSELRKVEIFLPDFPTQKRVAGMLSAYDDLIENNNRRIKILEESAQKIYTEWFVNFRFPGHEKVKMVDSGTEFGMIPEKWETKSLGSELELAYGKALKEENRILGDVLVCGSGGVVGAHNQKLVSGPGVVVGRKGNAGAVFWVHKDFFPIDTAFFVQTKLPIEFALYLLKSQNFILGDAAVPGLNREQAYRNPILLPTNNLIKDFADRVKPLRALADKLGDENLNLKKSRDLLIPQLVSGKLEVK